MLAISSICISAQQVALDSHRVSKGMLPGHDMISDLMKGSSMTMLVVNAEFKFPDLAIKQNSLY